MKMGAIGGVTDRFGVGRSAGTAKDAAQVAAPSSRLADALLLLCLHLGSMILVVMWPEGEEIKPFWWV